MMIRARKRKLIAVAAIAFLAGGCQLLAGVRDVGPYPDAGSGNSSQTTSTTTSGTGGSEPCTPGATKPCYTGPPGTEGVAMCRGGIAACSQAHEWGGCMGEVTPGPQSCASTTDVACLGKDNCVQWADVFGAGAVAHGVAVDAAGNSYVAIIFSGTIQVSNMPLTAKGAADLLVVKLDPTGALVWTAQFGAPGASISGPVITADDGGDVAIGGVASNAIPFGMASAGPGLFAAKLDPGGGVTWANGFSVSYTGSVLDALNGVAITPAGDVIIGGVFASSVNFGDGVVAGPATMNGYYGFVTSLRASDGLGGTGDGGVAGWHRLLCTGMAACAVTGVAMAGSNEVLVVGDFTSSAGFGSVPLMAVQGTQDGLVAKLSLAGDALWQQGIGGPDGFVTPRALAASADGGPIVAGDFSGTIVFTTGGMPTTSAGAQFVARYGFDSTFRWSQVLSSNVIHVASDVVGNVLLAGQFMGSLDLGGSMPLMSVGSANVFVAKLSDVPKLIWSKQYGDANSLPAADGIAVTPQGDPIVVGYTQDSISFGSGGSSPAGQEAAFIVKMSP
jgi:hypothetical protein